MKWLVLVGWHPFWLKTIGILTSDTSCESMTLLGISCYEVSRQVGPWSPKSGSISVSSCSDSSCQVTASKRTRSLWKCFAEHDTVGLYYRSVRSKTKWHTGSHVDPSIIGKLCRSCEHVSFTVTRNFIGSEHVEIRETTYRLRRKSRPPRKKGSLEQKKEAKRAEQGQHEQ